MQEENSRNIELRKNVDNLMSTLYDYLVRTREIIRGLAIQSSRDENSIRQMRKKCDVLYPAYLQYRELEEAINEKRERVRMVNSILLNVPQVVKEGDAFAAPRRRSLEEETNSDPVEIGDISEFSLWKIIREILRLVPKMQIVVLENNLKNLGISVSRAAIESALETHKTEFKITRQGRKKFVALKGV